MVVDLDQPLLDLQGAPLQENGTPWTVGGVALHALLSALPDEKPLAPPEVLTRYRLAQALLQGGTLECTPEQAALLRDRIARTSRLWTAGQALLAFEGGA